MTAKIAHLIRTAEANLTTAFNRFHDEDNLATLNAQLSTAASLLAIAKLLDDLVSIEVNKIQE